MTIFILLITMSVPLFADMKAYKLAPSSSLAAIHPRPAFPQDKNNFQSFQDYLLSVKGPLLSEEVEAIMTRLEYYITNWENLKLKYSYISTKQEVQCSFLTKNSLGAINAAARRNSTSTGDSSISNDLVPLISCIMLIADLMKKQSQLPYSSSESTSSHKDDFWVQALLKHPFTYMPKIGYVAHQAHVLTGKKSFIPICVPTSVTHFLVQSVCCAIQTNLASSRKKSPKIHMKNVLLIIEGILTTIKRETSSDLFIMYSFEFFTTISIYLEKVFMETMSSSEFLKQDVQDLLKPFQSFIFETYKGAKPHIRARDFMTLVSAPNITTFRKRVDGTLESYGSTLSLSQKDALKSYMLTMTILQQLNSVNLNKFETQQTFKLRGEITAEDFATKDERACLKFMFPYAYGSPYFTFDIIDLSNTDKHVPIGILFRWEVFKSKDKTDTLQHSPIILYVAKTYLPEKSGDKETSRLKFLYTLGGHLEILVDKVVSVDVKYTDWYADRLALMELSKTPSRSPFAVIARLYSAAKGKESAASNSTELVKLQDGLLGLTPIQVIEMINDKELGKGLKYGLYLGLSQKLEDFIEGSNTIVEDSHLANFAFLFGERLTMENCRVFDVAFHQVKILDKLILLLTSWEEKDFMRTIGIANPLVLGLTNELFECLSESNKVIYGKYRSDIMESEHKKALLEMIGEQGEVRERNNLKDSLLLYEKTLTKSKSARKVHKNIFTCEGVLEMAIIATVLIEKQPRKPLPAWFHAFKAYLLNPKLQTLNNLREHVKKEAKVFEMEPEDIYAPHIFTRSSTVYKKSA